MGCENESVNLIKIKTSLCISNVKALAGIIHGLETVFYDSTKSSVKSSMASAITKCINTQMRLFKDIPMSMEVQIYARVLQSGSEGINQVELFSEVEDFDTAWSAVRSLKSEGLITLKNGTLLPVSN